MLAAYRPLLRVPGALAFIAGGALARVGGAMFGVSIIVMVSSRRDSFSLAGAITAVGVLVLAAAGPILGRLVDRHGQRRIVLPFAIWSTVCGVATVVLSWIGAPSWTLFLTYGLSAILPEMGPLSRARWAHVFGAEPDIAAHGDVLRAGHGRGVLRARSRCWASCCRRCGSPRPGCSSPMSSTRRHGRLRLARARPNLPSCRTTTDPAGMPSPPRDARRRCRAHHGRGDLRRQRGGRRCGRRRRPGSKSFSSVILALFALGSTIAGIAFGAKGFPLDAEPSLAVCRARACSCWRRRPSSSPTCWGSRRHVGRRLCDRADAHHRHVVEPSRLVPQALVTEGMAVAITGILIGISTGAAIRRLGHRGWGPHAAYAVPVAAGLIAVVLSSAFFGRILRAERAASAADSEPAVPAS
jgi:hypothetical protein